MTPFRDKLDQAWTATGGLLCVGLDPVVASMRPAIRAAERPILAFGREIVDLTADLACAYKPQFAHYGAAGAEQDLAETIAYIRRRAPHAVVILDAKRGDIGSTAEMYALEAFNRHGADAVTVNPFMGEDAVAPFLSRPDRGAVVLCRTSNPGAAWMQELDCGGAPLYVRIAERAQAAWNALDNVMLVVGATAPEEMALARRAAPDIPFLVPGIGAQGGSIEAVRRAGACPDGRGLLVSASRSILYAGEPDAIRRAAEETHAALRWTAEDAAVPA